MSTPSASAFTMLGGGAAPVCDGDSCAVPPAAVDADAGADTT